MKRWIPEDKVQALLDEWMAGEYMVGEGIIGLRRLIAMATSDVKEQTQRPVEASAPAAPPAPSPADIEEAVRVVDRMTCQRCAEDRQRYESSMFVGCVIHQMDDPIRPSRLCTAQGRAIVTAILPILRGGK